MTCVYRLFSLYTCHNNVPVCANHAKKCVCTLRDNCSYRSVFDVGVSFRFFGYFFKSVSVSVVPKTSVVGFGFCTCALWSCSIFIIRRKY
jgi:hypothetical protein